MKIHKQNIHKIIDVVLPQTLLNKMSGMETYTDKILNENIFNIDTVEENLKEWEVSIIKEEQNLLDEIREACDKHDAAYFRPIFP